MDGREVLERKQSLWQLPHIPGNGREKRRRSICTSASEKDTGKDAREWTGQ